MEHIFITIEHSIRLIANGIWPLFLPFMIVLGIYLSLKTILYIQKRTTKKMCFSFKNIIGPASISLGAMIGTGAIIGVLGSISIFVQQGQTHFESIALWALIGALVMVPVAYCETLLSKIMQKTPREYISLLLSPKMGFLYVLLFCILYVFGFGGFQFSGIDTIMSIISSTYFQIHLLPLQRYVCIVLPVLLIIFVIIASKKHDIFMGAMTSMISIAVIGYFLFFFFFVYKTSYYIPTFLQSILEGMKDPINGFIGVPLGFILAMQRVLQTSETGLGALAMAAKEANSQPREAAMISMLTTIITIIASIIVTTYIISYGVHIGMVSYPVDATMRLVQYINTAIFVTGNIGLLILSLFTILSALTTLLGSYFFLSHLFHNSGNRNIIVYMITILIAGTLAIFGFEIIFDAVDLLLFAVAGINMIALAIFVTKKWKTYEITEKEMH